jgi:hypothetical protein
MEGIFIVALFGAIFGIVLDGMFWAASTFGGPSLNSDQNQAVIIICAVLAPVALGVCIAIIEYKDHRSLPR